MPTAKPTSARRAIDASRVYRLAFRLVAIVALVSLAAGVWWAYGAWVQVRQLKLRVLSPDLRPGIPAVVQVVTSGRTPVAVRLELVQGSRAEVVATLTVMPSHGGFYDLRPRQGTMTPALTGEFLSQFQAGPGTLRATAVGRPQWGHTPSPVVTEIPVVVVRP
jgi:hypothetical protein